MEELKSQLVKNEAIFKQVLTKDAKGFFEAQKTVDGFDNFVSRLGLNNDNTLSAGYYTFNLLTRNRVQLEAAYRGSWVVGAVVDSVAEDMTRAGIEITTNEQDADIKDIQSSISKLKIWQSLCDLTKWSRLYGGAIGVLDIQGQDLATPLDPSTVQQGQFKGIVVYDRWQLNPDLDQVIKNGPDIGLPAYYYVVTSQAQTDPTNPTPTGQIKIHHSRCIRMIGIQLPFFQAITEMMWGESILERLWDRLIAFDNATMSSASLIDRANLRTVGIEGLREIIASGGKAQEGLQAMFEMMRLMQVNEGLTLIDKNDEFASTAYSFAGLSDMMLQFGQQLSGASGIPLIRLFGQAPAGLNSTGDGDIRMYYNNINAQQESRLRGGVTMILKVLWQSVYGKPSPKDLEFTFTPLWQTSALDKTVIAKSNTETVLGAYEGGLVSREVAMKELRQSSGDTGLFSNISDEDIAEAALDEPPSPDAPLPGEEETPQPNSEEEKLDTPKDPVKNIDEKQKANRVISWLTGGRK